MEAKDFKFIGYNGKNYVFKDQNNREVLFSRCRKDLIELFSLNNSDFINEWFKVSYFETKPINQNDIGNEVFIISNMEVKK